MNGKNGIGKIAINDLSLLRAKLVLHLIHIKKSGGVGSSVTQLSDMIGVAKSTVSRAVGRCAEIGVIERYAGKHIMLTDEGERIGEELEHRCREVRLWLESMSGAAGVVTQDEVLHGALSLPDSTVRIIERNARMQRLHRRVGDRAVLSGEEFCAALGDGKYPVSIMCYRADADKNRKMPSMANDGIENDGELVIKNSSGTLRLKARPVEHVSSLGGTPIKGKLATLKYPDPNDAEYKDAQKKGDTYCFPASAMNFVCVSGRVMQGDIVLKMACSAGTKHMPESESVMEVFFRS
jgi:Mn-dependent DtxR family transcriptional regulator